ncbi:MAG: hypothetical protein GY950_06995, partial [bacterium]|nr:hypothetical protein [bacterium]
AFKSLPRENSGLLVTDLKLEPGRVPKDLIYPPYISKLKELFEDIQHRKERIMIYGARGNMTDHVLKLLEDYPEINILGFIDRSFGLREVRDIPVYRFEEIEKLRPTMILIAAESSGFAIYESIKKIETKIALVPLHDLTNTIWDVLLP